MYYVQTKFSLMENGKKIQMQCFPIIYTFCLHFFTFLIMAFETCNNIVPKTKVLFTHENF